jgi:hypothetical protein
MKVAIVHSHIPTVQVLARAIASRLNVDVMTFSCIENVLTSSMDYSIFVVYNNFGHKITGIRGVTLIRDQKPRAYIIGVSYKPSIERKFLLAGADASVLRAGNEVEELVTLVQNHLKTKPAVRPATHIVEQTQNQSEKQVLAPDSLSLPEILLIDKSKLAPVGQRAIEKLIARLKHEQENGSKRTLTRS